MKKIAVVRRNGLGDLLCAYPLVLFLKKRNDRITLFLSESNAQLLPFLPKPDKTVILPSRGNKYGSLFLSAIKNRQNFDVAISAKTSPMKLMNFFLYCLGAKKRIAYVDRDAWHSRLINYPIEHCKEDSNKYHQALKCLHTVAPEFREVPEELFPTLFVPHELKIKYSLSQSSLLLLLNATTTREASRIDEKKYAELVNRLYETSPFFVILLGQHKDGSRAKKIGGYLKCPYKVLFPRNFEEFMVILDESDLFFVPDGGVAHIGAALKKKGVVLFGETNPVEWGPLSKDMETFFHPEHVDRIPEEPIFQTLKRKLAEVICARDNP